MDIVNKDAKRALVDKETDLEADYDRTPLSKAEILANIAQLQKSGRGCPLLEVTVVRGRASCPLSGVQRWSLLGGCQCIIHMGFSIRD